MASRGVALLLVGLTMALIVATVAGFWLSQTVAEMVAWGLLGTLAVLAFAAAWVLLRAA